MGRLRKSRRYYVRKAGGQVPRHVTAAMQRLHPTVDILWESVARRWAMVQTIGGISQLVRFLGERETPTLANTVYYLNSIHPSRLKSKWAQERFLAQMDENPLAKDAQRRSADAIRVGSSDLYDQMRNRKVFAIRR